MRQKSLRENARALRSTGLTYPEIQQRLEQRVAKSTLSYWCHDVVVKQPFLSRLVVTQHNTHVKAREWALFANRKKRSNYFKLLVENNQHLLTAINEDTIKIILAVLYLGEGAKSLKQCTAEFSNADPDVISLYLFCLRHVYHIDESKFRCTVQCRADQPTGELESFWSDVVGISRSQFYPSRIDARTIGKITRKKDYKGVLRVTYLSAHVLRDLQVVIKLFCMGL